MKKIIIAMLLCVAMLVAFSGCAATSSPTSPVFTINVRPTVTPVPTPVPVSVLTADNGWSYAIESGKAVIYCYNGAETEIKLPNRVTQITYDKGKYEQGTIKTYAYYGDEMADVLSDSEIASMRTYEVSGIDELAISYFSKVKIDDSQYHCDLKKVIIPNDYPDVPIGLFAFVNDTLEVVFEDKVDLVYENNILYNKDKTVLYLCNDKNITSVTIPSTVKTIADGAFRNCVNLTSVTIPETVERVNAYAFYGCRELKTVTVKEGVLYIGNQAFNKCRNLEQITLAKSVRRIGVGSIAFHDGLSIYIYEGSTLDEYFHDETNMETSGDEKCFADYVKYIK